MAAVAYEQRRISTIRSTWVVAGVTLLLAGGMAAILAAFANIDGETGQRVGQGTMQDVLLALVSPVVLVPVSVLAAMAFGGEYRFGLIRQTLTMFPRRTSILMAKLWISVLWMFGLLVLAALVVIGVAFLFRSNIVFDPLASEYLLLMLRFVAFGIGYGLFAFALVLMTRNQALAIVILVMWWVVVESLVQGLVQGSSVSWLAHALPLSAGSAFARGDDMAMNAAVFSGVLVVFLAVAGGIFTRRDA